MVRLAFVLLAASVLLPAQSKIAVISSQQAVLETAEIKRAQAQLEAKFKPRQAEIEKVQTELAGLQSKLQAGQGKICRAMLSASATKSSNGSADACRKWCGNSPTSVASISLLTLRTRFTSSPRSNSRRTRPPLTTKPILSNRRAR
jgi:Flp pilus assembly protein TadB